MREVLKDKVIGGQRWRLGAKKREDLLRDYRCAARRLGCVACFLADTAPACGLCMCVFAAVLLSQNRCAGSCTASCAKCSQQVLPAFHHHLSVPCLQAHARPAAQRGWQQLSTYQRAAGPAAAAAATGSSGSQPAALPRRRWRLGWQCPGLLSPAGTHCLQPSTLCRQGASPAALACGSGGSASAAAGGGSCGGRRCSSSPCLPCSVWQPAAAAARKEQHLQPGWAAGAGRCWQHAGGSRGPDPRGHW